MKILSKRDVSRIDEHLEMAKIHLLGCIRKMKGKYWTSWAVGNLEYALTNINQCISDDEADKNFYQRFRNPPNTPKSKRLGWHKKGANDEQK